MCFSKPKPTKAATPAAAPAAPLEIAEEPEIGETRRKESEEAFGSEAPNYRHRGSGVNIPAGNSAIKM